MREALEYCKEFEDSYQCQREYRLLEHLRKRGAAVPSVVSASRFQLKMQHAGMDFVHWLSIPDVTAKHAMAALSDALAVTIHIAESGVWQWDLALRNLMIDVSDGPWPGTIRMIDFGNAICSDVPLSRPLLMLPTLEQHPDLRQAIEDDWRAFMQRHRLPQPENYLEAFEFPREPWEADEVGDLAVERLKLPWCVLAHACANLMTHASRLSPMLMPLMGIARAARLDSNRDEAIARRSLRALCTELRHASAPALDVTPQPRRRDPTSLEYSEAAGAVPQMGAGLFLREHDQHQFPTRGTTASRRVLSGASISALAGVISCGLGWWVIDVAWEIYSTPGSPTLVLAVAGAILWGVYSLAKPSTTSWRQRLRRFVTSQAISQILVIALFVSGSTPTASALITLAVFPLLCLWIGAPWKPKQE